MHLLLALARKILLPPLVVMTLVAAYRLSQGHPVELLDSLEGLGYLTIFILALWAPLPLIQRVSARVPVRWQSPVRLVLGIVAASITCGLLILLLGKLGVI